MNRLRAVHASSIDVGAALQQLVDRLELPRHRRPVDWLIGSAVALREERGLGIEQLAHPRQIVLPQRERNRFALRRGVELRVERLGQQPLHLHVAAIARNLQRAVVEPQIHRVVIVLEQKSRDVDAILANGEVERLAIGVVGARQRRIPGDERANGVEIAGDAGLDQRPEVGSAARRPQQLVIGSQRGGSQHATVPAGATRRGVRASANSRSRYSRASACCAAASFTAGSAARSVSRCSLACLRSCSSDGRSGR